MIPTTTFEAIQHWLEHGTHPDHLGSFVRAVLTNDLREATGIADDTNLSALKDTVSWVYWNVPGGTYGSREALVAYHKRREAERAQQRRVA